MSLQRKRLFGKTFKFPTDLPPFSPAAKEELEKPSHLRNMDPILRECRKFIKRKLGSTYLTKAEYDAFSQTLTMQYPKMQSKDTAQKWVRIHYISPNIHTIDIMLIQ